MAELGLRLPSFLNADKATQDEMLREIRNSDLVESKKQAMIESLVFLRDFQEQLKKDPTLNLKKVKKLFEAQVDKLKKMFLA